MEQQHDTTRPLRAVRRGLGAIALGALALGFSGAAEAAQVATPKRVSKASPQRSAGQAGQARAPLSLRAMLAGRLPNGTISNLGNYGPTSIVTSQQATSFITQIALSTEDMALLIPGIGGTVLVMRIRVESTQRDELFTLYVPSTPASVERPLLMAFHSFGVSHLDIFFNTDLLTEADQRGWLVLAPLQLSTVGDRQVSFASVQSQEHVEAALDFVLSNYAVDRDRLYGVGFSMGGGNALSYAARHRDRRSGAIAAAVNHTGTVALTNTYANSSPAVRDEFHLLFGGSPQAFPFRYQRSSVVDVDAAGQLVFGGRHMARNLQHVPMQSWFGQTDPFPYLIDQAARLDTFMQGLGGSDHQLFGVPVSPDCPTAALGHCWDTLDQTAICDWFELQSLDRSPDQGSVLADRDARWVNYDVTQDAVDQFSSFDYTVDRALNRLGITSSNNVARVGVTLGDIELDPALPFEVITRTLDATGDVVAIRGLNTAPNEVRRNGVLLTQDCAGGSQASWCYDAQTGVFELNETGSSTAVWRIIP